MVRFRSSFNNCLWVILIWAALDSVVLAHPMGNFSVSHYSNLKVQMNGVELLYIIDMAEVPTFQDKPELDSNSDGSISADEKERYLAKKVDSLRRGLSLMMNGVDLKLREVSRQLELLPGGLNLPTTKIKLRFRADYESLGLDGVNSLNFQDNNFPGRLGWKEIVAQAAEGAELLESSVPRSDKTQQLSTYPEDPTVSPPQDLTARLKIRLPAQVSGTSPVEDERREAGGAGSKLSRPATTGSFQQGDRRTRAEQQRLNQLLASSVLGVNVILLAMLVAFGLGAFHALSPGHGKTVVGAYLVGSRGTAKHAILLGGIVTVTHTFGVFLLGLVTLYASKYILPEKLYPWLGFFSGMAVVVIGLSLFLQRYRNLYIGSSTPGHGQEPGHKHTHKHDLHDHDLHEHHDHSHEHAHSHVHPAEHDHAHEHSHTHEPSHDHVHNQSLGSPLHDHDHAHEHPHEHAHSHEGTHAPARLTHTHGGVAHSHDYNDVRFKDLFTLGVSGGIVPCPSALVVLLSAISLNRVGLGLLMIVAFSLGLALVLMAIGLLMVYARGFMERVGGRGRLWQTLPVFSPLLIAALGVVIAIQSLVGAGIVQIQISGVN
jgi:nickel/cobalt transporter (NicO) family protein